nr:MAG TPA: Protein family of FAM222A [Caudoviricetes sp.]
MKKSLFFSTFRQNKDIQAKKIAPNPLSIKVFQEFQAIIERISAQTKNRKPEPAV